MIPALMIVHVGYVTVAAFVSRDLTRQDAKTLCPIAYEFS